MADKFITVPANIEDTVILKRFMNELVDKLNGNALVSYPIGYPDGAMPYSYAGILGSYVSNIIEAAGRANALTEEAKAYITGNLVTNVLQNSSDISTIIEQFGTFYDDSTSAAWYGLTVKTGELISGFTIAGIDSDTTTPGTAGSVFAINADIFTVGKAIEDIDDPAELAYVQANGLPYGTMYDSNTGNIIPAFLIEWNGTTYDIMFNGKVSFTNLSNTPVINKTWVQAEQPTTGMIVGDTWVDTNDSYKNYTYTSAGWKVAPAARSYIQAAAPTVGLNIGDTWVDSDDKNRSYIWSGSSWVESTLNIEALGYTKNRTFYQPYTSPPSGMIEGDIWYITDQGYKMHRYSGSTWQPVYETTIDGNRITTGVINADLITAGTLKVGYLETDHLLVNYMAPNHGITLGTAYQDTSNVYFTANDVLREELNWTWTVPANVAANSLINISAYYNLLNEGGSDPFIIHMRIYKNGSTLVNGYMARRLIASANAVYAGGETNYIEGTTTVSAGNTINVRIEVQINSGATSKFRDAMGVKAIIFNKTGI